VEEPSPPPEIRAKSPKPIVLHGQGRAEPQKQPGVGVLHVVHHHRGLPAEQRVDQPLVSRKPRLPRSSRPGTWSTAASRAKAWRGPSVPLDLGAAYFHQLEESQMLAAVRWRAKYDGVPPPLSRALTAADKYNYYFEADAPMSRQVYEGGASPLGAEQMGEPEVVLDEVALETEEGYPWLQGYDASSNTAYDEVSDLVLHHPQAIDASPAPATGGRGAYGATPPHHLPPASPAEGGMHVLHHHRNGATAHAHMAAAAEVATQVVGQQMAAVTPARWSPARWRREPVVE
jgi:hypothetical protein